MSYHNPGTPPRKSATFDDHTLAEIRRAAATGIYDIRGGGTKRKVPHLDDLLFLGASISRYPLEGYRERCETSVVLGTRHARKPIELKIPITIAGMSFGALSGPAKEALGRGATLAGTSTTTGGGRTSSPSRSARTSRRMPWSVWATGSRTSRSRAAPRSACRKGRASTFRKSARA